MLRIAQNRLDRRTAARYFVVLGGRGRAPRPSASRVVGPLAESVPWRDISEPLPCRLRDGAGVQLSRPWSCLVAVIRCPKVVAATSPAARTSSSSSLVRHDGAESNASALRLDAVKGRRRGETAPCFDFLTCPSGSFEHRSIRRRPRGSKGLMARLLGRWILDDVLQQRGVPLRVVAQELERLLRRHQSPSSGRGGRVRGA